ncbi:hypothetical protein EVAR_101930_1 [Eumeta japonica]|uniref:GAG-pre-integrase domain-containing protein n=1 Tax=Eumeta variegata TaxID=151549 RepID=A0A4C1TSM2_EUMVA|nr:hypothetical protein EVAR_101930_1 [Eumeta japonica]
MIMNTDGNFKLVAKRRGDLYYVQEISEKADIAEDEDVSEVLMWHCRLGHLNANDLAQASVRSSTPQIRAGNNGNPTHSAWTHHSEVLK